MLTFLVSEFISLGCKSLTLINAWSSFISDWFSLILMLILEVLIGE